MQDTDAPAPLAVEQVSFCRKAVRPVAWREPSDPNGVGPRGTSEGILIVGYILLVLVMIAAITEIVGFFGFDATFFDVAWAVIALAAPIYVRFTRRRFTARQEKAGVPELPPANARLQCVGLPGELPDIAELRSVPFEPRVFYALGESLVMQMIAAFAAAAGVSMLLDDPGWVAYIGGPCALYTAFQVSRHNVSNYFRVSPGRLEVLTYGFLRREPVRVRCYNLRAVHIAVDFRTQSFDIVMTAAEESRGHILWWTPERMEFAHMLFLAAVSEYETPELPQETL